jgi:hypothetical protein
MKDTQTKHTDIFHTYLEVTLCVGVLGNELFDVVSGCESSLNFSFQLFTCAGVT